MKIMKKIKWALVIVSTAILLFGLCLVIWPYFSAVALCYVLGAALLVIGITRIVCYTQRETWRFVYRYAMFLGIIDILIAVLLFVRPYNVMILLPVMFGIQVIADSIFHLETAFYAKRTGIRMWWLTLLVSVISLVLGFLLVLHPFEGSKALMIWIGISMIVDSIQNLYFVLHTANSIRKIVPEKKDYIDVDYIEIK